jgi:hypothetical protein
LLKGGKQEIKIERDRIKRGGLGVQLQNLFFITPFSE